MAQLRDGPTTRDIAKAVAMRWKKWPNKALAGGNGDVPTSGRLSSIAATKAIAAAKVDVVYTCATCPSIAPSIFRSRSYDRESIHVQTPTSFRLGGRIRQTENLCASKEFPRYASRHVQLYTACLNTSPTLVAGPSNGTWLIGRSGSRLRENYRALSSFPVEFNESSATVGTPAAHAYIAYLCVRIFTTRTAGTSAGIPARSEVTDR